MRISDWSSDVCSSDLDPAHAGLAADDAQRILLRGHGRRPQVSLIWTSTPAASSSFISASTVLSLGSTMSSTRLCVRVSFWSRASSEERSVGKECVSTCRYRWTQCPTKNKDKHKKYKNQTK